MEIRSVILALSLLIASVGTETKSSVPIFYGTIVEPARTTLMRAWTDSAQQVERAYCIEDYAVDYRADLLVPTDSVYILAVRAVSDARVVGATVSGIEAVDCAGKPTIHTHPPVTCGIPSRGAALDNPSAGCYYGGPNAFSCQASKTDYQALVDEQTAFGVVQCDRHAFVFYYRWQYTLDKSDRL